MRRLFTVRGTRVAVAAQNPECVPSMIPWLTRWRSPNQEQLLTVAKSELEETVHRTDVAIDSAALPG